MTSTDLSMDALLAIKSRRDTLSNQLGQEADDEAKQAKRFKASEGVRAFAAWFARQRTSQGVIMSGNHMLDVQKSVSDRFSIGLLDMRYFIAIPEECREWFFEMPWLHAAIGRDSSVLSLVCARSRAPGVTLPEFSMNFEIGVPSMLKMMSNYHYLDVRLITGVPTQLSAGRRSIDVSREVRMTLDIRVITGERTFVNLLDGRRANGMDIRSVTSAKAPSRRLKALDLDVPKTPLLSAGKAR